MILAANMLKIFIKSFTSTRIILCLIFPYHILYLQILLLSLTAGGIGLNLTGGNHILLLDPHWNPQLEQQAQDRIYRMGQTKHVYVYK